MHARQMISAHPDVRGNVDDRLVECVEACHDCAQTCTVCADACVAEQNVTELRQCIRLNMDCADICIATGAVGGRRTGANKQVLRQVLEVCAAAYRTCAEECERHAARHEHCKVCAQSCRRCEQACRDAAASVH